MNDPTVHYPLAIALLVMSLALPPGAAGLELTAGELELIGVRLAQPAAADAPAMAAAPGVLTVPPSADHLVATPTAGIVRPVSSIGRREG
ncbi:MAG: hypothetical protein ACU85V_04815 [Gammaproteobacteria bacterium]